MEHQTLSDLTEWKENRPVKQLFSTAVCNVTAWRHLRLRAHWLLVLIGGGGGRCSEGKVCILRSPGVAASHISLFSMVGVCGRSLTAGKILFTVFFCSQFTSGPKSFEFFGQYFAQMTEYFWTIKSLMHRSQSFSSELYLGKRKTCMWNLGNLVVFFVCL